MGKNVATKQDVYHAYRLLLGREPDNEGYAHFCSLIEAQALSPLELSWYFMDSTEFHKKQGVLTRPDAGAKPEFGVITLKSQACTQRQIESSSFRYWATRLRERPGGLHRKLWEWCFLSQALYERGMLVEGRRGLGFAVGTEPLTALFASFGCRVVASDLDPETADKAGWVSTNQHASSLQQLNSRSLCPNDAFAERVQFREVDMRAIPTDLCEFDFLWSSCALEHLGGLEYGLEFVLNAMDCLKPGGVAVHTTEFNCDSDDSTVETGNSVVYRRRDLMRLAERLTARGHAIEPFDFDLGDTEADRYVDEPPYAGRTHLKLRLGGFASTSFGLIIRKAA
jgi:methyltransferase family protein/uncharacterized protein DUF4214